MVRLAVEFDRFRDASLGSENVAYLDQRIEVAAIPFEDGAEMPQRLLLASLDHGHETSRVLLFDLFVFSAFPA